VTVTVTMSVAVMAGAGVAIAAGAGVVIAAVAGSGGSQGLNFAAGSGPLQPGSRRATQWNDRGLAVARLLPVVADDLADPAGRSGKG
jgi:hypothetical protein